MNFSTRRKPCGQGLRQPDISAPPSGIQRCSLLLLTAASATFLTGCLIIPVDYYQEGSRHNLNTKTQFDLQPGSTTKEEVVLTFGEPDDISEDGRRLVYAWTKVKAIYAIGIGNTGSAGEATKSYALKICFDDQNRVSDVKLLKKWGDQTPTQ